MQHPHSAPLAGWQSAVARSLGFVQRQTRNFKTMLVRRPLHGVATAITEQYNPIYATALGANALQLGALQSAGNAIGALISLPAGWWIDRHSLKKVFLLGTLLLVASGLIFMLAPSWGYLYPAFLLLYMGSRLTCNACTVTCANELVNIERATGRGVCRTLSALVALVMPMAAAGIIALSGGLTIAGLRPLYAIQVAIFALILVLLIFYYRDPLRVISTDSARPRIGRYFLQIFKDNPDLWRVMVIIGLLDLPWSMAMPFIPLYAHQFKGANEFILGGMTVAVNITTLLVAIPIGRWADRYGRKKILLAIAPLAYLGYLSLVFATGPSMLLLFGLLFGFNSINMGLISSMAAEEVSKDQMGRWIGCISLFRGLVGIPAPLLGGFIWHHVGAAFVFVIPIAIDLAIRLPLLISVRETLNLED